MKLKLGYMLLVTVVVDVYVIALKHLGLSVEISLKWYVFVS